MSPRFPSWLEPMAATLTRERFVGSDWVFERKLDGIRLLAFKHASKVQLLSRNRLPQNESYPSFVAAIGELPAQNLILDGEATGVWNARDPVGYHLFDILWRDDRDLTPLTLEARREELLKLPVKAPLQVVPRLKDDEPWELARRHGWEGVIAKRVDSVYEHRRSPHWLKMKVEASQELVVGGFTDPQGKRVGLGALLVGYYEGNDFVFAGKLGTGFDSKLLLTLRQRLDRLEVPSTPFTRAEGLPRKGVHWVEPEVVVQVAFMEWTSHGKLRHPRLLGLRTDKAAREVTRDAG
ncbi:MAG: putative ligase-like protein [Polyangiaceae bacterium]|jgi:DNA ligase D-like protein (predicted ligase)|nr:putative ligase-like protein [Polyangiaceae bacterium]